MKHKNKSISYLRKTLKVIMWVVISFVLLFAILAVLIQIPSIQTKFVHYATSFVSSKTHTKVVIKKISISFPKSVVIQGIYLEDTKKDTLGYIGEIKVNLAFRDLLNHKIHVSSLVLEDVNLILSRTETDSLFNFNFLITAFSDTIKLKKVEPKTPSKWTFRVDNVSLKSIRFHYNDNYGGTFLAAVFSDLKLKINQLDLVKLVFNIEELYVDGVIASVLIKKTTTATNNTKSESVLPIISANKIQINNTNFSFGDSVNNQSLSVFVNQLMVKEGSVDIQNEMVTINKLSLSKSQIQYNVFNKVSTNTTVKVISSSTVKSDWKVSAMSIDLDDNSIAYNVVNKPERGNAFDADHMVYQHLTLDATKCFYSSVKTEVSVLRFSTIDQNNFSITKFETDFCMDQHSITANNLKLKTNNSSITADLSIMYSSLKSLSDSFQFMIVNANMKNVSVKNADILYFNHQLIKQAFFKNVGNITTLAGVINGAVNNLAGKKLVIHTGVNTVIKTDFILKGLPDVKTAYFNFPNLRIISGRKDIIMMADTSIPKSIELPENISLEIAFKGMLKSFETTLDLSSSFGSAHVFASIDKTENFRSSINITNFDLGRLLKNDSMFGPVSLTAETNGQGLDKKTIKATIKADVSQIYLNKYTYHNLSLDGNITGQQFEGKISLDDKNAAFDFDGLVNLNPNQEQYKFNLNLKGADLQKLNLTKDDIRIGLNIVSDLKGGSVNKLNGNVGITKIFVAHEGKRYILDSFLFASINEPRKSEIRVNSAIIGIKYKGTLSPVNLPKELIRFINNYFPFSEPDLVKQESELQNFNFEIQLHNHPVLSEVFLPQLKEFEPGLIQGSFNSEKNDLKFNVKMKKIVYGTTEINDLVLDVNSDSKSLNYKVSSSKVSNSQINLDNFLVDGSIADNKINVSVSSIGEKQNKKLLVRSQLTKDKANFKLTLDPKDFYLMNSRWDIAADNYIEFGKQGFLIHHLFINKAESQINITSVHDQFNDDLNIAINNFNLHDVSGIIETDTSLIRGIIDGNVLLKRVNKAYGLIADVKISKLFLREVPIGNLSVKADNPTTERFDVDVNLSGTDNNLTASGYFIPKGGDNSIKIKVAIQSLSLKTVEAFSMGNITEASGQLSGNFLVEGKTATPDVTGELTFNNAFIKPAVLNNQLQLKHETIQLKKDGIYFNSFTILDPTGNPATINGAVKMEHFKNFIFALHVNSNNFLLFNTTMKDNKVYFGRMIIDSKIDVNGPMTLPVVNAKIKMKRGSNFTFAVPENKLTTDKGEDVVEFEDSIKLNPILYQDQKKVIQKSALTGFDISSIVEIDKQATLRLLLDPASKDSLVVKGEAALNFTIDRSGKMSLTGAYNINDGSYLVSLESVVKRKFNIVSGSMIIWNGDPLDAEISINATYSVRASPIDLIADQMTSLSETDKNAYKQRYPFLILLKLRGEILHPEISFEIQLRPEDKGILGGAVNAKLNMLNEDPSALNKQVFALLVLSRFIQENPLQTDANGGTSTVVRSTVGTFLSTQLNQLSSKAVPGVELNFDIQSYDDYGSGQAQGRTQVDIGVKKQLLNERLSIQVGGIVDVEGARAKQNTASDITGDVTVEYKLTNDGRYRLKGFRHNQYEGAIEGQLVETGAGILYVRDFDKWKEFFKAPRTKDEAGRTKIERNTLEKTNSNDTINLK